MLFNIGSDQKVYALNDSLTSLVADFIAIPPPETDSAVLLPANTIADSTININVKRNGQCGCSWSCSRKEYIGQG
jgi:hypothetical protein